MNFEHWFGASKAVKNGLPLVVYHGTARSFDEFDSSKARSDLNNQYQGDGIFFTELPEVAGKYAYAARNDNFDKSLMFSAVQKVMPENVAVLFMNVVNHGYKSAWELPDEQIRSVLDASRNANVDINTLLDLCEFVEGTRYDVDSERDVNISEVLLNFMTGSGRHGLPDWAINSAIELGLESALPAPHIIPVYLKIDNLLITDNAEDAKRARENGFDGVCYTGANTVSDEPEWIVFSPSQIRTAIGTAQYKHKQILGSAQSAIRHIEQSFIPTAWKLPRL